MSHISNDSFWQHISDQLQSEIPAARFDAWIHSLSAHYSDHKLTIKVPSRFFVDGLKSNYGQRITEIACDLAGSPVTISYEVDASLASHSVQSDKNEEPASPASLVDGFIDPRFTFANFVVGSGNEFCHAASHAVADNPGEIYNPLYLYGGVGLGKTHLINAVANCLIDRGITKIAYRTGERFTNELIQAIRNGTSEQFRNQYRQVDVLIIDDIQFIAGKEKTQEEFFHTFNALYEVKKQIILTSDRSPRELTNLMERLRSRFNWGLVADIQAPDLETRLAILSSKAELAGVTLDKDVGHLLAARITNNVRELEGALTRLTAHSTLTGRVIDLTFARHVLRDLLHEEVRSVNIEDIQKKVASYFNINIREMSSSKRSKNIAYPRQVAMYATKELTTMSLPEIGRNFGGRDHTTVLHAVRKIKKMRDESDDFNEEMNRIINLLKQ
ncbi:chromosomal replication initiator protein DnaA [Mariprofundus sp. EBB-1]|uniref:chromosomal replication initiator protein DnaA n=1 Tax=Mariprofundus sp. EBB-1 TaxID=2650971 RepID=UPI000EF1D753|nr:chromosomal replication initiator protein DnaA [Mariprofundus sp. EBB-1]RLL54800.1 chromosomal replication initiator protein DnaA [Mariprofundus sp. EBB-1]